MPRRPREPREPRAPRDTRQPDPPSKPAPPRPLRPQTVKLVTGEIEEVLGTGHSVMPDQQLVIWGPRIRGEGQQVRTYVNRSHVLWIDRGEAIPGSERLDEPE